MKNHWLHTALLFVLVCFALPTLADEVKSDEPAPEEDTFIGEWYVQLMEGQVTPLDKPVRLTFEKTGIVRVFEDEDEEEAMAYTFDEAKATITIVEQDDPTDIEAIIKYSFVDDMLIMRISEGRGGGEDDEEVIELTRNAKGTKRHQAMRKDGVDSWSPKQQLRRLIQMRQLHVASFSYMLDMDKTASSIGDLVTGGYIELDAALPAAAQKQLPKEFKDWKEKPKQDWINQHVGCVYLPAENKNKATDEDRIAFFALPANEKQKTISLVFGDGRAETKDTAEADKLIKKQTGHTIADWMKTTSPGSGKMVLPEKKEDDPK